MNRLNNNSIADSYNNKNIVINELIGLKAKVSKCSDKKQAGLEGFVIDETKNTLLLRSSGKDLRIVKKNATFKFYVGRKIFIVDGKEINFRPYERIEKALKFYKKRNL